MRHMGYLTLLVQTALLAVPNIAQSEVAAYGPKYATKDAEEKGSKTKDQDKSQNKDGVPLSKQVTRGTNPGLETVESALESAYLNNTELAASVTRVNQADERTVQAKAGYRPRVDGSMSIGASRTINSGDSVRLGSTAPRTEGAPTARGAIEVRQNIYAGGSTVAAVKGAENNVLAARANLMSNQQTIFFQVVQAFLEIMTAQAEINQFQGNVKALKETLAATNDRFKVGEETRTSVAQAEAQYAEGVAQLKEAEARLEAQHATFQKLTGRRAKSVQKPSISKDLPATLEQAVQIAMENNPEVIQAKYEEAAAKYEVDRIGGALLPQVDLRAVSTRTEATNRQRFLSGAQLRTKDNSTNIDATVTVSVPIYEQGLTRAQKREAHEKSSERRIGVETARRKITESLITFWQNYQAAKANIEQFKSQVAARQVSLEGTRQEMQVGTKILLDVLNAQRDLLGAQLNLIRAERTFWLESYRLLSAMGRLTSKQMKLKVHHYDPSIHYNETKDRV